MVCPAESNSFADFWGHFKPVNGGRKWLQSVENTSLNSTNIRRIFFSFDGLVTPRSQLCSKSPRVKSFFCHVALSALLNHDHNMIHTVRTQCSDRRSLRCVPCAHMHAASMLMQLVQVTRVRFQNKIKNPIRLNINYL